MTGVVKWFDIQRGFGFLVGPDGNDVFVHVKAVRPDAHAKRELYAGDVVDYEAQDTGKGPRARFVDLVKRVGPKVGIPAAKQYVLNH